MQSTITVEGGDSSHVEGIDTEATMKILKMQSEIISMSKTYIRPASGESVDEYEARKHRVGHILNKIQLFEEQKKKWDSDRPRVCQVPKLATLDVGGEKFEVFPAKLQGEHLLGVLLSGLYPIQPDCVESCIFLDCSPNHFEHVLRHIEGQTTENPRHYSSDERQGMMEAALFFNLPDWVRQLSTMTGSSKKRHRRGVLFCDEVEDGGGVEIMARREEEGEEVGQLKMLDSVLDETETTLRLLQEQLEHRKQRWARNIRLLDHIHKADKVCLVVDHVQMAISKEHLLSRGDGFFGPLLNEAQRIGNNIITLTGLSTMGFARILDLLRGRNPSHWRLNEAQMDELERNITLFQLQGFVFTSEPCKDHFVTGPNYIVSKDGKTVQKSKGSTWNATALGSFRVTPDINKVTWILRHVVPQGNSPSKTDNIMLGIAPWDMNQETVSNYNICGWFLSMCDGVKYGSQHTDNKIECVAPNASLTIMIEKGNIFFSSNNGPLIEIFHGIPRDKPLRLCVLLGRVKNNTVSLLA